MGRELKRVPLDFDYPLNKVWYGYYFSFCHESYSAGCEGCKAYAKIIGAEMTEYGCPNFKKAFGIEGKIEPPEGDGYQLWETTSEGSPVSPVFKTVEELAEWCEENATVFAKIKVSKEEWLKMFNGDFITFKLSDNVVVI